MVTGESENIGAWNKGWGWEWQELFMGDPFVVLSV